MNSSSGRFRLRELMIVVVALGLAIPFLVWALPGPSPEERAAAEQREMDEQGRQVAERHAEEIMAIGGVVSIGYGLIDYPVGDARGIRIGVVDEEAAERVREQVPEELEGFPVRIQVTGEFTFL